jgi:uncharacterized protein (DUF983 family)
MAYYPPVSPFAVGLAGKCPRCGEGALFKGFLGLRERCNACGLNYAEADSGDGPAVFVIFIVGFLAVAVAFILRFVFEAPTWVALGVSIGTTIGLSLALLRPMKATMIALQFQNKAAEGRIDE